MQVYAKKDKIRSKSSNESKKSFITNRRILREKFIDIRDELFPDNWNIAVDNWSNKRYCPICKSSLKSCYNSFQMHSNEFHDDWADLIKPWVQWKGLRNKKN